MPPFHDRREAGRRLAGRLLELELEPERPVVLALPRGGVPVGFEVASRLGAPLDLVMVRKIGAPSNPEFGIGAVVDGASPVTVMDAEVARRTGADDAYVAAAVRRELAEIERRRALYLKGRRPVEVRGRTAIVVDDGVATGSTMRVALRALRAQGVARLVMAVPVGPVDTLADLAAECDEAVCLEAAEDFEAVGAFYRDFHQLDDAEVTALLDRAPGAVPPA